MYYLGYGTPLTLLTTQVPHALLGHVAAHTSHDQTIIAACVFGAAFPLFLVAAYFVSANRSSQLCIQAPDPPSSHTLLSAGGRYAPLALFTPSIAVCNRLSAYVHGSAMRFTRQQLHS